MNEMKPNVNNCIRCGMNHKELEFKEFTRPIVFENEWRYWAMCPEVNEPILLRVKIIENE